MTKTFIYLFIFWPILVYISFQASICPPNCSLCENEKKCSRCHDGYYLIGKKQYSSFNEIYCTNQDLSSGFYVDNSNSVYYNCSNDDYIYLNGDYSKCYSKDLKGLTYYYTYDDAQKMFYSCDNGISNCKDCKYFNGTLKCEKCIQNYYLISDDNFRCYSLEELNNSYYKKDAFTYASCSKLSHCIQCRSSSLCTKCEDNFYIVDSLCQNLSQITPINEYYLNDENTTYYSCSNSVENCKTCSEKNKCTECKEGYSIVDDDFTKCVKESQILPTQLYYSLNGGKNYYSCKNLENKNCLKCKITNSDDPNNLIINCTQCQNGAVYIDYNQNQCFLEESLNKNEHYRINRINYGKCSTSIENCVTCQSKDHCLSCDNDYGIVDDEVLYCLSITEKMTDNTIYKKNNSFYYSCSKTEGCEKCTDKSNCISTISSDYCILDGIPKKLKVPDEYYYSSSDYLCKKCEDVIPHCELCENETSCVKCKEGYTIKNNVRGVCESSAGLSADDKYFTQDNGINYYSCGEISIDGIKGIENCKRCEYDNNLKKNNCKECESNY